MKKKRNVRAYERRLKAIKRRLKKWGDVELKGDDAPEKCLDILERIVEKGRPVIRNLTWNTVDKYFHSLIENMCFRNEERYNKLMERHSIIDDKADEVNEPLLFEVRESSLQGEGMHYSLEANRERIYIKSGRRDAYSLELAARGEY